MRKLNHNLTEGNIYNSLLLFSIPFVIANLIQALYGTVDLVVVGLFTDTQGISSVAIGTQVMQIVNGLIIGFTMGGTILIGQYYGANKKEDTQEVIGTMFTLGLIISLFIMIFMWVITNPLLNILRTPDEAFMMPGNMSPLPPAVLFLYLDIMLLVLYYVVWAILKGRFCLSA